ncbi:MAG: RNA polymerase sigma factor [Verrucomicrobiales bacterium]|nr:RNA polymerase sigma factor [Verrucomicrobiales bacterium]
MAAVAKRELLPVPAARAGSSEAWDFLFRRYQLPLYAYVQELVGQEQLSLDLVQETFIAAARHLGSLREDRKFGSWLFGIAHQKCVQHWRRHAREDPLDPELADSASDPGDIPGEALIRREQEAAFMDCLQQLPPAHRSVLLLHYLEEFPIEEIAIITGTPIGTVKSRLHHARRSLRALLTRSSEPHPTAPTP